MLGKGREGARASIRKSQTIGKSWENRLLIGRVAKGSYVLRVLSVH